MLPKDYREELRERLLSFLWRQWAQLGLASAQVKTRDDWVIDPEALLLLTGTLGRWDPRLFDEAIDWLVKNARFFNLPRLKSLSKRHSFRSQAVSFAVTQVAGGTDSRLHWRLPTPEDVTEVGPLFFGSDGKPMPAYGESDATFARFGYARGRLELRGLSQRFNPVMPETSLLRLRSLLGVSARAEILLYLFTHKASHPSGIARETGFSQKTIQDALVDMTASGVIHVAKLESRMKTYFVLEKDRAPFLYMPEHPPRWVTWPPLFRSLEYLWLELSKQWTEPMDPLLLSSQLRTLMKGIRPGIESAGFGELLTSGDLHSGETYTQVFVEDTERLLAALRA